MNLVSSNGHTALGRAAELGLTPIVSHLLDAEESNNMTHNSTPASSSYTPQATSTAVTSSVEQQCLNNDSNSSHKSVSMIGAQTATCICDNIFYGSVVDESFDRCSCPNIGEACIDDGSENLMENFMRFGNVNISQNSYLESSTSFISYTSESSQSEDDNCSSISSEFSDSELAPAVYLEDNEILKPVAELEHHLSLDVDNFNGAKPKVILRNNSKRQSRKHKSICSFYLESDILDDDIGSMLHEDEDIDDNFEVRCSFKVPLLPSGALDNFMHIPEASTSKVLHQDNHFWEYSMSTNSSIELEDCIASSNPSASDSVSGNESSSGIHFSKSSKRCSNINSSQSVPCKYGKSSYANYCCSNKLDEIYPSSEENTDTCKIRTTLPPSEHGKCTKYIKSINSKKETTNKTYLESGRNEPHLDKTSLSTFVSEINSVSKALSYTLPRLSSSSNHGSLPTFDESLSSSSQDALRCSNTDVTSITQQSLAIDKVTRITDTVSARRPTDLIALTNGRGTTMNGRLPDRVSQAETIATRDTRVIPLAPIDRIEPSMTPPAINTKDNAKQCNIGYYVMEYQEKKGKYN